MIESFYHMTSKQRADKILKTLKKTFPNVKISLNYSNNFELLIAVMMSAHTTDAQVNKVTEKLFPKYKGVSEVEEIRNFAKIAEKTLQNEIKSIGLYKTKAKNVKEASKIILNKYKGKIPKTMNELIELPGVGRKTANVVLSHAFNIIEGIAVDTHVRRRAFELGLTKNTDPVKIEKDLMELFKRKDWPLLTLLLIVYGRSKRSLFFD